MKCINIACITERIRRAVIFIYGQRVCILENRVESTSTKSFNFHSYIYMYAIRTSRSSAGKFELQDRWVITCNLRNKQKCAIAKCIATCFRFSNNKIMYYVHGNCMLKKTLCHSQTVWPVEPLNLFFKKLSFSKSN